MDLAKTILGPEEEAVDEYETVASELTAGINEKNPKMVAQALKAFVAMCEMQEDLPEVE